VGDGMTLRYPLSRLAGDYARSAAGLALTGLPAASLPAFSTGSIVLGSLAALFLGLGAHAATRQATRVVVTGEYIESRPFAARLAWSELTQVKLAYYSTRRDRRDGWMQLVLKSDRRTLRVDSRLEGFDEVAREAARAACARGLELTPTSASNFQALGIELEPGVAEPLEQPARPERRR